MKVQHSTDPYKKKGDTSLGTAYILSKSAEDKKYLTEFRNKEGVVYGWHIYAPSWKDAQIQADERGIGEKVIGYVPE